MSVLTRMQELEAALQAILDAWESVPENVQVPDEINDDELWNEARRLLGRDVPSLFDSID